MFMALARVAKTDLSGFYGAPKIKVITGTNPAANTETSDAVPAGKLWLIISYGVTLVETVQTPLPRLEIKDGAGTSLGIFPGMSAAMSAGVTSTLKWAPTLPLTAGAGATANTGPIPDEIYLPETFTIGTNTTGIGVNCDYGAPVIYILEYS